jgi:hypothetical protein
VSGIAQWTDWAAVGEGVVFMFAGIVVVLGVAWLANHLKHRGRTVSRVDGPCCLGHHDGDGPDEESDGPTSPPSGWFGERATRRAHPWLNGPDLSDEFWRANPTEPLLPSEIVRWNTITRRYEWVKRDQVAPSRGVQHAFREGVVNRGRRELA